jgi:hypothetical protein
MRSWGGRLENKAVRRLAAFLILFLSAASPSAVLAEPFVREDWIYAVEPTRLDSWGINHWGITDFMLPYRIIQRGKHQAESSYANNWKFKSETGGARGVGLRLLSTGLDTALFEAPQNLDHAMAHDARARELSRDFPGTYRYVSKRFTQILPAYFGGKELDEQTERTSASAGADVRTLENSTLWEMDNQFAYFAAKDVLIEGAANATQVENVLFHRFQMAQLSWTAVDQACIPGHDGSNGATPIQCRAESGSAPDFSNYLMDLNSGRYGVASAAAYRLKISDLQRANELQFLDPVFLLAAYGYADDYLLHGRNQSRIAMIPLPGTGVSYLPGLRIDLSPFGIEYIQDNYFRYQNTLVNLFWTRGDDKYERRLGAGVDADGIPIGSSLKGGVFGELYKQPLLTRMLNTAPLTPAEIGLLHNVYHYGARLRIVLASFGDSKNPKQALLTITAGRKNTGWIPGEYILGSTYVETGVGLHF